MQRTVTHGNWSSTELHCHINVKETLAVLFSLQSLGQNIHNVNVKLLIDNTSTVSVIKHMGTSNNDLLNKFAKEIWLWAITHHVWLFPVYIASADNLADTPSRKVYMDAEWQLDPNVFRNIVSKLAFKPAIDLFASRLNTQLPRYYSYQPDPSAEGTDAFTFSWSNTHFYAFPPFSCVNQCLQKIRQDKAAGILIAPNWPTQPFFPNYKECL